MPVKFAFRQDSIGIGCNGPTLQPVEILAALRAMPNMLVAAQDAAYRSSVLGPGTVRVGCEAALRFGWDRWRGPCGGFVGMTVFGASGPAEVLYPHFGITPEAIVAGARRLLAIQPETATP